jgi:hypothetical protein
MRPITTCGFSSSGSLAIGECPELRWISIGDLLAAPRGQDSLDGRTRLSIKRIAESFSWACFAPLIVTPADGGKFFVIDGFRRATAAAVVGLDAVPCQVVTADDDQLAVACRVLNGGSRPDSRMATHAASVTYSEPTALRLSAVCERAGVQLLRYPVPIDRQAAGQTMAVAALSACLGRYGEATVITALHCVTQTANNLPGMLTGRIIKALCAVLDSDHDLREGGLALLEAFDSIDLAAIQAEALETAAKKKTRPGAMMVEKIRAKLARALAERLTLSPDLPVPRAKIFQGTPKRSPQALGQFQTGRRRSAAFD